MNLDDLLREAWERPMYYDRQGNPISQEGWIQLFGDMDYKIVKQTLVGATIVSTVWLGLDHAFIGPPQIFETMFMSRDEYPSVWFGHVHIGPEFEDFQERYGTEEHARRRHEEIVLRLRLLGLLQTRYAQLVRTP